jgi:hypothetical protein
MSRAARSLRATGLCSSSLTSMIGAEGPIVIPKAIPDRGQLHPRGTVEVGLPDSRIVITAGRQADGIHAAIRG